MTDVDTEALDHYRPSDRAEGWADGVLRMMRADRALLDGLCRARNPIEIEAFVLGKHQDRVQRFKQAVVEAAAKEAAVAEAILNLAEKEIERERLVRQQGSEVDELDQRSAAIGLARIDNAARQIRVHMAGALKEYENFRLLIDRDYADLATLTEEDLLQHEARYWVSKLAHQLAMDQLAVGHISIGNLTAVSQLPVDLRDEVLALAQVNVREWRGVLAASDANAQRMLQTSTPARALADEGRPPVGFLPARLWKDAPSDYPAHLVLRASTGEPIDRVDVMIATLHRPGDDVWLSSAFEAPAGLNVCTHAIECPDPLLIGEYRNRVVLSARSVGARYLFFVDDDLLAPQDALLRLYGRMQTTGALVVGGHYPRKQSALLEAASMVREQVDGEAKMPVSADARGLVSVDWSLACGLTLYRVDVFGRYPYPWFRTTTHGTEDTYATARMLEAGVEVWLDADVRAAHVDKATGQRWAFPPRAAVMLPP